MNYEERIRQKIEANKLALQKLGLSKTKEILLKRKKHCKRKVQPSFQKPLPLRKKSTRIKQQVVEKLPDEPIFSSGNREINLGSKLSTIKSTVISLSLRSHDCSSLGDASTQFSNIDILSSHQNLLFLCSSSDGKIHISSDHIKPNRRRHGIRKKIFSEQSHAGNISSCFFNPLDYSKIFSASHDKTVKYWTVSATDKLTCLSEEMYESGVTAITSPPFGSKEIYVGLGSGKIERFSVFDHKKKKDDVNSKEISYYNKISSLDLHSNGYTLIADKRNSIYVLDTRKLDLKNPVDRVAMNQSGMQTQFSSDMRMLISSRKNGTVYSIPYENSELQTGKTNYRHVGGSTRFCSLSENSNIIAMGTSNETKERDVKLFFVGPPSSLSRNQIVHLHSLRNEFTQGTQVDVAYNAKAKILVSLSIYGKTSIWQA
eukprot:snap_masked-scaffold_14-processed-gene-2.27-mRNA-1 protein AED:1.00 eAED:1.00 QI:0/0/0/0/1/1/2/0/428